MFDASHWKYGRDMLPFMSSYWFQMIISLNNNVGDSPTMKAMLDDLSKQLKTIEDAGLSKLAKSPTKSPMKNIQMVKNRAQLKQVRKNTD